MKYIFNKKTNKKSRSDLRKRQTDAERFLWTRIRKKQVGGYRFVRQYGVGNYIIDFYCAEKRVGIELDGGQHNDHHIKNYDEKRTKFLNDLNIKILRFWNDDVLKEVDSVLERILLELERK